jgi:hypothetical protein
VSEHSTVVEKCGELIDNALAQLFSPAGRMLCAINQIALPQVLLPTLWQPHCLDHGETQKKFCDGGFTYAENRNHACQRYSPSGNRSLGPGIPLRDQPRGHRLVHQGHNRPGHNRAQHQHRWLSRRLPIQTEPLDCRGSRLRLRPKLPALLFDGRFSRIQANVHQATGGFVFRAPTSKLRIDPYLFAEGGAHECTPAGKVK